MKIEYHFDFHLFSEQEIDKEALLNLTESLVSCLLPTIGARSKFLANLSKLQATQVQWR
jgi:hypothetical protein